MSRYVAFLRGMNLGRRRITNVELCACFDGMGFKHVSAFLASGNVVFDATRVASSAKLIERIEDGLRRSLGYEVPTFLRTAAELRAIAGREVFTEDLEESAGKIQVVLLAREPDAAARQTVLKLDTKDDRLDIQGRELFWLPRGNLLQSDLDLALIDATVGPMTVRTKRTLERIVAKVLDA